MKAADGMALLDKADAEDSLADFIRLGWDSLEPNTMFVDGYVVDAICEHLEAVSRGEITRLLINVPPGFMKSLTTNVFFPAWEWGALGKAHLRYISASHEKELSIRDNVRCRDLMLSEWYQSHWGNAFEFKGDQNAKLKYENDQTGWRLASSTNAGLTGNRADRILLDDPHAVKDLESVAIREEALRWFSETLPTRLNNKTSAIIVIMQRIHQRDVSGLILKEDLGYEHLCLPMEYEKRHRCFTSVPRAGQEPERVTRLMSESMPIPAWLTEEDFKREQSEGLLPLNYEPEWVSRTCWDFRTEEYELLWPTRFDLEQVEELKKAFRAWGGTYAEAGQLQQRPAPRGGGMFQRDDFQMLEKAPEGIRWHVGWDLASSRDGHAAYTVRVKIGLHEGRVIVGDVLRFRGTPYEVETAVLGAARRDGVSTRISMPQDPGQAGVAQKATFLKLLHGFDVHFSPESGSKEDRAKPLAAQSEGGNLYLVRAEWNEPFIAEACLFPNGEFLDQVDAASRAYTDLVRAPQMLIGLAPRTIGPSDGSLVPTNYLR